MGVKAEELGPGEAAAVLKENLSGLGPVARRVVGGYCDTPRDAPLADWERDAAAPNLHRSFEQTSS